MRQVKLAKQSFSPSKIICVGRNYVDHAKELGNPIPTEIVFFLKANSAISDELHAHLDEPIHYETELCFLIKNKKLAGVGLGLDLTKRELQSKLKKSSLPWERSKTFNHSALFSEFKPLPKNIDSLHFKLSIDGAVTQEGNIDLMIFKPEVILNECQSFLELEDGDIIMTGTPKGVGPLNRGSVYSVSLFDGPTLLVEKSWTAL